jgi:hypothetical protein
VDERNWNESIGQKQDESSEKVSAGLQSMAILHRFSGERSRTAEAEDVGITKRRRTHGIRGASN